jgi:hypothetical protein
MAAVPSGPSLDSTPHYTQREEEGGRKGVRNDSRKYKYDWKVIREKRRKLVKKGKKRRPGC